MSDNRGYETRSDSPSQKTGTQGQVGGIGGQSSTASEGLRGRMQDMRERASETVDDVREKASEKLGNIRERASEAINTASGQISDAKSQAMNAVHEGVSHLSSRVHDMDLSMTTENVKVFTREKPIQALMIAGGVGFALGMLLRPSH